MQTSHRRSNNMWWRSISTNEHKKFLLRKKGWIHFDSAAAEIEKCRRQQIQEPCKPSVKRSSPTLSGRKRLSSYNSSGLFQHSDEQIDDVKISVKFISFGTTCKIGVNYFLPTSILSMLKMLGSYMKYIIVFTKAFMKSIGKVSNLGEK